MTIVKLIPFWLFILLYHLGGNIHFTYLPIIGDKLSSTWFAGLIIGSLSLIQFILDVPAGFLLDRFGYTKMMRIGISIFVLACLVLVLVPGLIGFILSTFISAFGWLFLTPGVNAYILSSAPKDKAEKFMAHRDMFNAAGVCLGTLSVTFTITSSPQTVGLISAFILSLALLFISITPKDNISVHQEIKLVHHHFYIRRNIFKKLFKALCKLNPASWMLLLQGFCASAFYGTLWFVVPLMITDPSNKIFGMSLGIFDFAILLVGFILGKFFGHLKEKRMIIVGLLLFSLAGLMVGHQIEWMFLFFAFIASVGDETSNIALWSWLAQLDQNHDTDGEVSSVISFFIDIGWGVGPIIAGILYGVFGGKLTITLSAIPILITFLISTWLIYRYNSTLKTISNTHQYPKRTRSKR